MIAAYRLFNYSTGGAIYTELTMIHPPGSRLEFERVVPVVVSIARQEDNSVVVGSDPDVGRAISSVSSQQEECGSLILDKTRTLFINISAIYF